MEPRRRGKPLGGGVKRTREQKQTEMRRRVALHEIWLATRLKQWPDLPLESLESVVRILRGEAA